MVYRLRVISLGLPGRHSFCHDVEMGYTKWTDWYENIYLCIFVDSSDLEYLFRRFDKHTVLSEKKLPIAYCDWIRASILFFRYTHSKACDRNIVTSPLTNTVTGCISGQ